MDFKEIGERVEKAFDAVKEFFKTKVLAGMTVGEIVTNSLLGGAGWALAHKLFSAIFGAFATTPAGLLLSGIVGALAAVKGAQAVYRPDLVSVQNTALAVMVALLGAGLIAYFAPGIVTPPELTTMAQTVVATVFPPG